RVDSRRALVERAELAVEALELHAGRNVLAEPGQTAIDVGEAGLERAESLVEAGERVRVGAELEPGQARGQLVGDQAIDAGEATIELGEATIDAGELALEPGGAGIELTEARVEAVEPRVEAVELGQRVELAVE